MMFGGDAGTRRDGRRTNSVSTLDISYQCSYSGMGDYMKVHLDAYGICH